MIHPDDERRRPHFTASVRRREGRRRDLDVLVFLPSRPGAIVSLEGIYRWTSAHGYTAHKEHVIIEGVPTQFLASPGPAGDEAIETAATLEYEDVPTRVVHGLSL
jgi:hypothetical protein